MGPIASLWRRLGSPYALSLKVWLWTTPIVVLGTAFTFGVEVFFAFPALALAMGLATHLATGLLTFIASLTYLRKASWTSPRPVSVILTFIAMGLSRGLVLASFAALTEMPAEPDFLGRAIGSMWLFVFWASALTLFLDSSERYRAARLKLDQDLETIRGFQSDRQQALDSLRTDYLNQVRRILEPALERVKSAIDLEKLASEIIDPVSYRELAAQIASASALQSKAEQPQLRQLVSDVVSMRVGAIAVAALGALSLAPPMVRQAGFIGLLGVLAAFATIWLGAWLANRPSAINSRARMVFVLPAFVLSLLVAELLQQQLVGVSISLTTMTIGAWIVGFAVALVSLWDRRMRETSTTIEQSSQQLDLLQSKLQQELWVERQSLDQLVHSEIQGRLRSAAVMARLTGTEKDMAELKAECIRALGGKNEIVSLDEFLNELDTLWGQALKLEFDLAGSVRAALDSDVYLRGAFFAVVREAVLNAVKHASCTKIAVSAEISESRTLRVMVSNDGAFQPGSRVGLGSRLFDNLTHSWSLSRIGDSTVLSLELPLLQQQLTT